MTGIERIKSIFAKRLQGEKCLIAFLTAGDPSVSESEMLCKTALDTADMLEIGIPFSDPMADGPVIQSSYVRALQLNIKISEVMEMVCNLRKQTDKPLVFMVYINILLQMGVGKFLEKCAAIGIDGLIIPDLPPDEAEEVINYANKLGLAINFLVAPTSTPERIRMAAQASTGFIYVVSLRGVTGVRTQLSAELPDFVQRVRNIADKPIAIGFGISTPEHVREAAAISDGVIVGSALVKTIASGNNFAVKQRCLTELLASLQSAL